MTSADVIEALGWVNLLGAVAIVAVIAMRSPARRLFGARLAYGLWLLPLASGLAALSPVRQVIVEATPLTLGAEVAPAVTVETTR